MDIKVAFTSLDTVPNVEHALECTHGLAERMRIASRPAHLKRRPNRLEHGFFPLPEEYVQSLSDTQRAQLGIRQLRGEWYRTENGPLERSPYYQHRVHMLEHGFSALNGEIEARGMRLAVHENMFTLELRLITLHLESGPLGPFVGGLMDMGDWWLPFHDPEERTTVGGPLAHLRFVEFLAALKREAIPSLCIRDPSGYLEHGDVFALLEAMNIATDAFGSVWQALFPDTDMPDIQDIHQAIPNLTGPVGSAERITKLEHFLFTHGVSAPDIDDMLERGR